MGCRSWTSESHNGSNSWSPGVFPSAAGLVTHSSGGAGILARVPSSAPGTQKDFGVLIKACVDSGATCPTPYRSLLEFRP